MNLLKETQEEIAVLNYSPKDIVFIGSSDGKYKCSWDDFCRLADREYDDGYGAQQVASDLVILFSDGSRLFRAEYDGAENWVHLKPVPLGASTKQIKNLFAREIGWESLEELNR